MQFASAITEYVLPGLPVTAVLMYGLSSLPGRPLDRLWSEQEWTTILGLLIPLLGVAYMLGVVVHFAARWVLLDWYNDQERKVWRYFERYCGPRLHLLGPSIQEELDTLKPDIPDQDHPKHKRRLVHRVRDFMGRAVLALLRFVCDSIVGRVVDRESSDASQVQDFEERDVSGWVLWRMRMFLCNHFPTSAQEVLHLQAVSRAARGALALPLSLIIWALVDFGNLLAVIHRTSVSHWANWFFPLALLLLGIALMRAVRWTYAYRWGVVCRSTVAAFLSATKPS